MKHLMTKLTIATGSLKRLLNKWTGGPRGWSHMKWLDDEYLRLKGVSNKEIPVQTDEEDAAQLKVYIRELELELRDALDELSRQKEPVSTDNMLKSRGRKRQKWRRAEKLKTARLSTSATTRSRRQRKRFERNRQKCRRQSGPRRRGCRAKVHTRRAHVTSA